MARISGIEEEKLGPSVTYNPPEGDPETTEVFGMPMAKGESVNAVELIGESRAKVALRKLAGNPYFQVEGAPDISENAQKRQEAKQRVEEAKQKIEEAKQARQQEGGNQLGTSAMPPENYPMPAAQTLEQAPTPGPRRR
jgi:hypothetical protein